MIYKHFLGRTERTRAENSVHSDVKMTFCSENISELFRMSSFIIFSKKKRFAAFHFIALH